MTSRWAKFREGFSPWAGLALGAAGAAVAHQGGSDTVFDQCAASPEAVLIFGLLGLLLAGAGAFLSWGVYRGGSEGPVRHVIAIVSLGTAALVAFMILLAIIASLVIPPCFG